MLPDNILPILYQDPDILVINKPAGLLSIQDGYNPDLPNAARLAESIFGKIWVVHRLDKETSGILILARNAEAHRCLSIQFQNHSVKKTYSLIVVGSPEWNSVTVEIPLRINGDRKHRTIVDTKLGKYAVTGFSVIERFSGFTFLTAKPGTGYTHQIRAHAAAIGFPLLKDPLYWIPNQPKNKSVLPSSLPIQRLCLHASSISIDHPTQNMQFNFEAPLAKDILDTINFLRGSTK